MQENSTILELQFPNESHRKMYVKAMEEMKKNWETLKHPDGTFDYNNIDFDGVLMKVESDKTWTVSWRVPATTLFLVDVSRDVLIGAINIRHHIEHPNLVFRNGHIWYGILPSEQRKWYGTTILQLGLKEARKLWIQKVLITCNSSNEASQRVIEKNNWVFESEKLDTNGEKFRRYWIEII